MSKKVINFANVISLEKHIEILLLCNDCVMVPGLGGFMAYHQCAKYSDVDCQIIPPLRNLGFNPKLKANDNLLVQSFMEAFDISFPEAMQRIEDEVCEINNRLTNEGCYTFNGIGTLHTNKDGNFDFTPIKSGLLTPELYAFDAVQINELHNLKLAEDNGKTRISDETDAAKAEGIELDNTEPEKTREEYISIRVSAIRNVAAVLIALIGFFLFASPLTTGNAGMNVGKINTDMLYQIMPKTIVKGDVENVSPITLNEKETGAVKHLEKEKTTPEVVNYKSQDPDNGKVEKSFCLVMASQVSRANGNAFLKVVHKQGFDSARMIGSGKKRKIIYGEFASETEAYKELNRLHSNEYFKQAWVFEIK